MPNLGSALSIATLGEGGGGLGSLWRNGEDGFLFYPMSDLTRLLLLSTGSSGNVAADTDPVGLDLDNHSWGASTLAQVMAAATELVTNGSFATGDLTGFSLNGSGDITATYNSGRMRLARGAGAIAGHPYQAITTVAGKSYTVSAGVFLATGALRVGTSIGGSQLSGSLNFPPNQTALITFVATGPTTYLGFWPTNTSETVEFDDISVKLVPGNHALQATTTKRPFYKTNSGKPFLLFDGTDDSLNSPFNPTNAMTMAAAVRVTASLSDQYVMGGGETGAVARAYLGVQGTTNLARGVWGSTSLFGAADVTGADHVLLVTGNASTVSLWVDGVKVATATPTGAPGGTTGPIIIGGINPNATPSGWFAGRGAAFLALNRMVTDAEVALITSQLQRTYQ